MAGLWAQGSFGLPILQLTETVPTVAQTSTSAEILRSLGYWYFYGRDGLSQWTQAGTIYTQNVLLLAWSFLLPALALVSAAVTRWRHRIYFVALVLVGLVLGIGTHPYADPSPFGALLKVSTDTTAGFALRNTPRAVPLLTIGVAALVGVGVEALLGRLRQGDPGRARRWGRVVVAAVVVLTVVNLPPLWQGHLVQPDLQFPETLPRYWTDAAKALDARHTDLRVLELPGSDFAAYRWGETQDPILPGLLTRPWIGRELTAYGTPPSADLIRALDEPIQEGTFDPSTVAPIARLMSASDVLLRLDTQYERYHGPRPADLWQEMGAGDPIAGLRAPTTFGPVTDPPTDPRQPMHDEPLLARPPGQDATPRLAVFPVDGARPIVRAEPTGGPLVVSGDGQGLVDAAGAGLLPDDRAILYAATLATDPTLSTQVAADDPSVLVTDTNRRRAQRWGTIREDNGATEAPGSTPLVPRPEGRPPRRVPRRR